MHVTLFRTINSEMFHILVLRLYTCLCIDSFCLCEVLNETWYMYLGSQTKITIVLNMIDDRIFGL